jgi:hypothetical protein
MRQDSSTGKDRPRQLGVRLLILLVVAIGPVAGAYTGTRTAPLGVLVLGAVLVGVVIEREIDRAAPLGPTRCGFCGRPRDQVPRLVVGEHGLAICEDCVAVCDGMLRPPVGANAEASGADPWQPPKA